MQIIPKSPVEVTPAKADLAALAVDPTDLEVAP